MKITDIKFGMLRVPLKTPFKTALRTVDTVEDIVVIVHTDTGHVGYGEAPATAVITGDTHGSIVEAVGKFIRPRLIGQDIANLNRITDLIQTALERNTSAKAAVEIAVYDLWAQLYDAPLYKMLGGGDPVITTDITISVDYIDKMVADSISAVERGFESLKIKVGKDIGLDIERVKAIYSAVEGRALLRLDANQGWTAKQAVFAMQTLERAGVNLELLEHDGFSGNYGFYEAVDYTASRLPHGKTRSVVRSFMAHHQGMSFLSLGYVLLGQPMQRRFCSDPEIEAAL